MLSSICKKKKCYDLLSSITCTILTTITMHTCLPYMYIVYFGLRIEHNVRQTVGYEQALNIGIVDLHRQSHVSHDMRALR